MSVDEIKGLVQQTSFRSFGDGALAPLKLNRRGEMCLIDFYTQMALEQRGFELRAGIDTAEETGNAPIATTAAETGLDIKAGLTVLPCFYSGYITTAGSITEVTLKTIGTQPTAATTAIAPNPLWRGSSIASHVVGELNDAGGVTTTADGTTTTNLLFFWGSSVALGAYNLSWEWKPLQPSLAVGPATVYTQVGGATLGPEYCFTIHWIEMPTIVLD